jgi:hypothetical protein
MELINEVLDQNLQAEIISKNFHSSNFSLTIKGKPENSKKYYYDKVIYGNYGEPLLNSNGYIVGYKINETECAMVHKFQDKNNNSCNEVTIRDFNTEKNTFGEEKLISWLDIKTENGFTREFGDVKYFHNKENKVYNVEKIFICESFPSHKKDTLQDTKIGTIDLETFGDSSGLGFQTVFAGG